jgi:hypothetical protein
MEHHIKIYPPARFLNEKNIGAEDANAKYYIPTIILPSIFTWLVFRDVSVSLASSAFVLFWLLVVGWCQRLDSIILSLSNSFFLCFPLSKKKKNSKTIFTITTTWKVRGWKSIDSFKSCESFTTSTTKAPC